jgi:hypothetical protein
MKSKVSTYIIFALLALTITPGFSQCLIEDAHELINYQRTDEVIEDDITKLVSSKWHKSTSNFEFKMFLYYQKLDAFPYKLGINKGSITLSITNIGNAQNAIVYYSDGSFENITPFQVEWKKENIAFPTKISFSLKGDILSTEDKITETNITNSQRHPRWIENSIDLSKMPTKLAILTDKGSKEYIITSTDYLNMQCILNRYKIIHEEDIK